MNFRTTCILALCLGTSALHAQTNELLKVTTHTLPNGFSVYLNEDSTATKVFGAVMVNAGTVNESAEATGMAHYLEHLLFKGTDQLGTFDYEKEKPHLDSINSLYEQMGATDDEDKIAQIQKSINEQAILASQYGLPTEFDKLLSEIGGTDQNAYTAMDMTLYYNNFPAQEIGKWLDIYTERFRHPVFRSFQSELEVVYEEKNRSMDNMGSKIFEELNKMLFPNLPYGQWTGLGTIEHLKKPSLIKMYDFYDTNYVSGNMSLVLSGNFKTNEILPLIELTFGSLDEGEAPVLSLPELQPIMGEQVKKVRYTPVKVGIMGFQTVPYNHPDRVAMDVCEYLLTNNSETGMIDQIQLSGQMLYASSVPITFNRASGFILFYVPKLIGQSLNKAESIILAPLDSVKNGHFSNEMLIASKNDLYNSFQTQLEDVSNRGEKIAEAANRGMTWDNYIKYPEKVSEVTKDDVMRVAKKYFGENRVKLLSYTGFPKKVKLKKPPFEPVATSQDSSSAYAKKFDKIPPVPSSPRFLDFDSDVSQVTLEGGHQIIAAKNPINDLFDMTIAFRIGKLQDRELYRTVEHLNYVGAGDYTMAELKQAFANLGCTYYLQCTDNFATLHLNGMEQNLKQALQLTNTLLNQAKPDDKAVQIQYDDAKSEKKFAKRDRVHMGFVLLEYAKYGKESEYLTKQTAKEIKQLESEKLIRQFIDITANYQAEIMYTGNLPIDSLSELIKSNVFLSKAPKSNPISVQAKVPFEQNRILVIHDGKAVQNQIHFYIEGISETPDQYAQANAFNEYFGRGFNGLVVQEIREYRSLAYSVRAKYYLPRLVGLQGEFTSYMGCQADKTNEAITVMVDLIENMPEKPERIPSIKNGLQLRVITDYPNFRDIPGDIVDYQRRGYTADPNLASLDFLKKVEMKDITDFHSSTLKNKPYTIVIYGNKKVLDMEKLKALGAVTELKVSDIIVF